MSYRVRWGQEKNHTLETMEQARLFLAKKMLGRAGNFAKASVQRKMLTEIAQELQDLTRPLVCFRATQAGSFWAIERISESAQQLKSECAETRLRSALINGNESRATTIASSATDAQ